MSVVRVQRQQGRPMPVLMFPPPEHKIRREVVERRFNQDAQSLAEEIRRDRLQQDLLHELEVKQAAIGDDPNGPSIIFAHVFDMLVGQRMENQRLTARLARHEAT